MYNHLRLLRIAAVKLCREFAEKSSSVQGFYRYVQCHIHRIFGIEGYNAGLDGNMGKT